MAEAVKEKPSSFAEVVENCCAQLRRRQIQGSLPCAKRTAEIMRALLTMQRHPDAASLIDDVRAVGYKLQAAKPVELAVGNIVRRVLHLIREEAQTEKSDSEADSNDAVPQGKADGKQDVMKSQGVEHLHANEVILTLGMSDTTYAFLREAARKREFQVVVAEGAPRYDGHLQARKLADAGIQVTAIPDSAVFAMMARANKVLVGAHAVLANGGAIAPAGIHMVALAAHKHSTPLVVLVGLHKLSPQFPHDPDLLYNDFRGPAEVADSDMQARGLPQHS
ncbi:eukaryotic initiation factor [Dunaliella salina]|uniref:Translation initiation factor eIF2B subunit beta n=1 Tax=Dunaliella salina TaxID=3046 RepID=A0ABQ7GV22_DUNSA|nr:eukaryotic initiation factor [Dunaliella salina]|eukprot:KAF5838469.1 eukaryotic initiation factor [Dunaliella salina]